MNVALRTLVYTMAKLEANPFNSQHFQFKNFSIKLLYQNAGHMTTI